MFDLQMKRYFPLPDYDLGEPERVKVRILGKIINENYTRLLIKRPDLDFKTVMDLDKVQKGLPIADADAKKLRSQGLIEGRKPNYYVSVKVAAITDNRSGYIKNRAFDDEYYKDLIISKDQLAGKVKQLFEEIDELNAREDEEYEGFNLDEMGERSTLTAEKLEKRIREFNEKLAGKPQPKKIYRLVRTLEKDCLERQKKI